MKNIKYIRLFGLFIVLVLNACDKKCSTEYSATCLDIIPISTDTGFGCAQWNERWFYDEANNSCIKHSWSGCNESGFETEKECEKCDCQ